jgi:phosphatidylserine decarboxylase
MAWSEKQRGPMIPMARDGWRFVLPLAGAALICWIFGLTATGLFLFVLAGAVGSFFRDPERTLPPGDHLVLSPADGVLRYIEEMETELPDGRTVRLRRVSIVLSIFNGHIQRAPFAGRIAAIRYNPGKFLNAFDDKSSKDNENNEVWIESPSGLLGVRQIAGLIARRIVCWNKPGEKVREGERIGLIRFGSRVELFLPLEARLVAREGQTVKAGLSVIAEMPTPGAGA